MGRNYNMDCQCCGGEIAHFVYPVASSATDRKLLGIVHPWTCVCWGCWGGLSIFYHARNKVLEARRIRRF